MTASAETGDAFSLDGYRALLDGLRARGYAPRSFARAPLRDRGKHLTTIAAALLHTRSELYNPMTNAGMKALDRLSALGHEIGLHFDASLYADDDAALDSGAERECQALEAATQRHGGMISFYRPSQRLSGPPELLGGRPHAYQPRFFSEMGYCSDSRGGWHHGHPFDHAAVAEGRALQLLPHPIWWVGDGTPQDRLRAFHRARSRQLDLELAAQCDVHTPIRTDHDG